MSDRPFTPTDKARLAVWLAREPESLLDRTEDALADRTAECERLQAELDDLALSERVLVARLKAAWAEADRTALRLAAMRRRAWGLAGALVAALTWVSLGWPWQLVGALTGAAVGVALALASED